MSNSWNQGNCLGCYLMNSFADAVNNLFSTEPYCGCGHGSHGHGCGCRGNSPQTFTNGFVSGVNAANEVFGLGNGNNGGCGCNSGCGNQGNALPAFANGNGGCGCNCNCGCGSNADLSAYTACGNQCYDAYYAQQYALYPYNQPNNVCSCGNGYAF